MVAKPSLEFLVGQNCSDMDSFIQLNGSQLHLHSDVVEAFKALQERASVAGISLIGVSGYRSYERQLVIWNEKVQGIRPLKDGNGNPVDRISLQDVDLVFTILRWSALPGASRHHWGTDVDVIDTTAMPEGYQVQLLPAEYTEQGVFAKLGIWLTENISDDECLGFFRPYRKELGGISPEPWHLSYAKLSHDYQQCLEPQLLKNHIENSSILLKEVVLQHFEEIYQRFILVPEYCYPKSSIGG